MPKSEYNSLPTFDLMNFVPYRVTVLAQLMSEGLAKEYRDRFGITIPQWRVLVHLAYSGGNISVREVEQRVAMEKSKVSRAAAKLESLGFIEKRINKDDRRLICLTLTPKGEALMAELLPLAKTYQNEIKAKLGDRYGQFMDCVELLASEEA